MAHPFKNESVPNLCPKRSKEIQQRYKEWKQIEGNLLNQIDLLTNLMFRVVYDDCFVSCDCCALFKVFTSRNKPHLDVYFP